MLLVNSVGKDVTPPHESLPAAAVNLSCGANKTRRGTEGTETIKTTTKKQKKKDVVRLIKRSVLFLFRPLVTIPLTHSLPPSSFSNTLDIHHNCLQPLSNYYFNQHREKHIPLNCSPIIFAVGRSRGVQEECKRLLSVAY